MFSKLPTKWHQESKPLKKQAISNHIGESINVNSLFIAIYNHSTIFDRIYKGKFVMSRFAQL